MIVLAEFLFEQLSPYVGKGNPPLTISIENKNYRTNCTSVRLECLKRNPQCINCGLMGNIWHLEYTLENQMRGVQPHLNLYNKSYLSPVLRVRGNTDSFNSGKYAKSILMTRDHIIPKFHGGPDTLENSQTMCIVCNNEKGCTYESDDGRSSILSHNSRKEIQAII